MGLNYAKLVSQGRAKSIGVCWSGEELDALVTLEKERKLHRTIAADYIRNGILTVEDYDKAVEEDFKPLNVDEAKKKAAKDLADAGKKAVEKTSRKVKAKKTDDKK